MHIVYHLIVFYLTAHLIWCLWCEKKLWNQVSVALVLIIFLLRLFLIK